MYPAKMMSSMQTYLFQNKFTAEQDMDVPNLEWLMKYTYDVTM